MSLAKPIPLTPQQKAEKEYAAWKERVQQLYELAQATYDVQNAETKKAIGILRDRIESISYGVLRFGAVTFTLDAETRLKNSLYLAVELVKDLAIFNIRVASFEFNTERCAECGLRIVPAKKKKGRK